MKLATILLSLLIFTLLFSCEKGAREGMDGAHFTEGLVNFNMQTLQTELNQLTTDLSPGISPEISPDAPYGQQENMHILVDRLNEQCPQVEVTLIGYACIDTYLPKSVLSVQTDSSGCEICRYWMF